MKWRVDKHAPVGGFADQTKSGEVASMVTNVERRKERTLKATDLVEGDKIRFTWRIPEHPPNYRYEATFWKLDENEGGKGFWVKGGRCLTKVIDTNLDHKLFSL